MLMIDENHFKAMIGKYVPTERIEDFKKDLISETVSDDEISNFIRAQQNVLNPGVDNSFVGSRQSVRGSIEKLKRRGP